jgi:Family of unknown function (DUF6788)
MKKTSAAPDSWTREYDRLRKGLAQIGYISQGSVLDRASLRPPRSGYQWTRKVAGKTITVALTNQQFAALGQAVENERKLWRTIRKMENLSRRILFENQPHTGRRKRLSSKVLGLI